MCVCVCMCIYIYIYIYICLLYVCKPPLYGGLGFMHTYIHTCTHIPDPNQASSLREQRRSWLHTYIHTHTHVHISQIRIKPPLCENNDGCGLRFLKDAVAVTTVTLTEVNDHPVLYSCPRMFLKNDGVQPYPGQDVNNIIRWDKSDGGEKCSLLRVTNEVCIM